MGRTRGPGRSGDVSWTSLTIDMLRRFRFNTRLDDDGDVQFLALAENYRAVRIVQSCRHLGTIVQAGAGMKREIASRANAG